MLFDYTEQNNVQKYKIGIPLLRTLRYAAFILYLNIVN